MANDYQREQPRRKRTRLSVVDLTSSSPVTNSPRYPGNSSVLITGHVIPVDDQPPTPPGPPGNPSKSSESPEPIITADSPTRPSGQDHLEEYNCPICFCPPTNPCLTPCGHVMCGQCLFSAVKANLKRAGVPFAGPRGNAANPPRCPMCRSPLPGWDGRGGGIVPMHEAKEMLSPRAAQSVA